MFRVFALLGFMVFTATAAQAACTDPVGNEGNQVYNSTYKVMQFCNGTHWISMASTYTSAAWAPSGTALYYNGGYVGIGKDTPIFPLDIETSSSSTQLKLKNPSNNTYIRLDRTAGYQVGILLSSDSSNRWAMLTENNSSEPGSDVGTDFSIRRYSDAGLSTGIVFFIQRSAGYVGIGTTNPSYKLHVNGSVAGVGAYNALSDARFKTKVEDLSYGLADVMKLRPVSYEWKDQSEDWQHGRKVGLIAQEVEAVVPEVVSTANDPSQTKSLAYSELVPVLIQAVQELKAEVDALKQALDQ